MPDRATPFFDAGEVTTLIRFLDYLRGSVVAKVQGLSDDDAIRPLTPSGTSLGGIVKHLTNVERLWVQYLWGGHDEVPLDRNHWKPDQPIAMLVADYESVCDRNNEVVTADPDLDRKCARPWDDELLTLRWVLVHLIEETGRHAGHADIVAS